MRRNRIRRFFQQKQYAIASLILFAAIAAMTGVYISNRITSERQEEELAQKEADLLDAAEDESQNFALDEKVPDPFADTDDLSQKNQEDAKSVNSVIRPRENTQNTDNQPGQTDTDTESVRKNDGSENLFDDSKTGEKTGGQQTKQQSGAQNAKQQEQKKETTTQAKAATLHFSPDTDLAWPLQGDVILSYSMDQTVYFATLEQYKYNPALVIAGKVNDPVKAAATGRITDISTNEETGVTVTMDLGDGYRAVYGQLKEVLYKEGATVEAGNAIGYIAEPTKYYSVEGSNLYFALEKDGEPVNPMQYIQ